MSEPQPGEVYFEFTVIGRQVKAMQALYADPR